MPTDNTQDHSDPDPPDKGPSAQVSTSDHVVWGLSVAWIVLVAILWAMGAKGARESQVFAITVIAYLACWGPFFAASAHSRRQKGMRFIAASGALLFIVVILELLVPIASVDYRRVFGKYVPPWEDSRHVLDRELIHILRPHSHARGKSKGGDLSTFNNVPRVTEVSYDLKYDHNGFRNDVDYEQVDCAVIGDSIVEAGGVLSDELFTTRVAASLGISVANFGQSYYGPQQELVVLKRFAAPLKPRVALWVFFEGNDLQDVWRYRQSVARWPEIVDKHSSWSGRSFTANFCYWLSTRVTRPKPSERRDILGLVTTEQGDRKIWFGYAGKALTPLDKDALKITSEAIAEALALCKAQGIQLVVAFAPTKYRVYAEVCHFEEGAQIRNWTVNDLPEALSASVRGISDDIGFLDLTSHLEQAAGRGEILYYPDDTHWSPAGHEVVGHAVSEFLKAEHPDLSARE